MRPVGLSYTFWVTCAVTKPGRSEFSPVIRPFAEQTEPSNASDKAQYPLSRQVGSSFKNSNVRLRPKGSRKQIFRLKIGFIFVLIAKVGEILIEV